MSKKGTKALASATLMSLVLTTALSAGPVKAAQGSVTRVGAADRYATAAQVATTNWTTSDNVVLVSGEGYADAVSASALAKNLDAPILLTTAGSLNSDTKAALNTLKAKNVYVVGGNASVSASVRADLKANYNLVELGGANRYETNAAVAQKLVDLGVNPSNVIMVGGEGFSDALSVAPIAAAKGQILLLGMNDSNYMKPVLDFVAKNKSNVTVVGTKNVISDAILNAVGGTRVDGGRDRWDTNQKVLANFKDTVKMDSLYVASAAYNAQDNGYADALVASALAGKKSAPLVLVDKDGNEGTANALAYIKANATDKTDLNVVGGTGVVSDATVNAINDAVKGSPVFSGEITSVEAVADQTVNAKADDEVLKFTVNSGRQVTVNEVLDAGYTVEFITDEDVFDNNDKRSSKDGELDKSLLKALVDNDTDKFKYQVVIKKDGVIIAETPMTQVNVINAETTAKTISDVTVKLGTKSYTDGNDAVELKSKTLVVDEIATVTKVKGNTEDGKSNVTITDKKYYSSNEFVATVDETTGEITAKAKGDFNLIVKSGSNKKEISMKVVDEKRKVNKATASVSSISLGKPTTSDTIKTTFDLFIYDQYGDAMQGLDGKGATANSVYNADDVKFSVTDIVKNGDDELAATSVVTPTDEDGKVKVEVSTDKNKKSGSGTLKVKNNDGKQLLALTIKVGFAGDVDSYKIEPVGKDTDFTVDLNPEAADKDGNAKVKFKVNKYDKNGNYLGAVQNGENGVVVEVTEPTAKKILDGTSDSAILTPDADEFKIQTLFDNKDAKILNTSAKDAETGTLTISVKVDGRVKSSKTVTVKDSSPRISGATFGKNLEVKTGGSIDLKDIVKPEDISISGSAVDGKVRIDLDGNVFMNYDEGETGGVKEVGSTDSAIEFMFGQDIYLGRIVFTEPTGVTVSDFSGDNGTVTFTNTSKDDKDVTVGIIRAHETSPSYTAKIRVNK